MLNPSIENVNLNTSDCEGIGVMVKKQVKNYENYTKWKITREI